MATVTPKSRLHETRIDLPEAVRAKTIEVLNQTLAVTLDLKTQVKQAHWNVKGRYFFQLHELFDQLATEIETFVDLFAERVTTLGGTALGTARLAAQNSILPEYPYDITNGVDHVRALVERYALFAKHLRENIDKTTEWNDAVTADMYTQVGRDIDTRLWFLEAHLQAND